MSKDIKENTSLNKANWWDTLPDNVKSKVEFAIKEADEGKNLTHDQVKKKICSLVYKVIWTEHVSKSCQTKIKPS